MKLDDFIARRIRALSALDMNYAREIIPSATSDTARLAALHKARYECVDIADKLRHESRDWLQEHKLRRMYGEPWPENKKELPK